MLDKMYYGNSVREWGISLLIVVGSLLINKLILVLHRKVIKRMTAKSTMRLDDIFFDALEKPILLGVILLAIWIATGRLDLGANVHEMIRKAYDVLVVLNVTWFFARVATGLIEELFVDSTKHSSRGTGGGFSFDTRLRPLIKRGVLILVWFIGIVTALHNVGITLTALMGTLGIGGIAFALAAQDTIKNIFGGITIFTDKTFHIGDIIKVDANEGSVVDIGLRSTRIRTYDRRIVTIPNYKLMDAVVTNISSEPGRRVVLELGVTYDTTPARMQEAVRILKELPSRIPGMKDKDHTAFFSDFGDSALVITFVYFIRKSADIFDTRSAVNFEILRAFTAAGLSFAFPSRSVYIEGYTDRGTAGQGTN
jgi:MscS family membrane protein